MKQIVSERAKLKAKVQVTTIFLIVLIILLHLSAQKLKNNREKNDDDKITCIAPWCPKMQRLMSIKNCSNSITQSVSCIHLRYFYVCFSWFTILEVLPKQWQIQVWTDFFRASHKFFETCNVMLFCGKKCDLLNVWTCFFCLSTYFWILFVRNWSKMLKNGSRIPTNSKNLRTTLRKFWYLCVLLLALSVCQLFFTTCFHSNFSQTHTQPFYGSMDFVCDNPGEPVPEETFTHSHLSWSSIVPYQLHPSTTIHGRCCKITIEVSTAMSASLQCRHVSAASIPLIRFCCYG